MACGVSDVLHLLMGTINEYLSLCFGVWLSVDQHRFLFISKCLQSAAVPLPVGY